MPGKHLRFILISCLLLHHYGANANAAGAGAWIDSPTGKCFQSIEEYFEITYGPAFREDENVKSFEIGKERSGKKLTWAIDMTPGTNVTRVLFSTDLSGRSCAILYSPLSSSISFRLNSNGTLPHVVTSKNTPPPGFPVTIIKFKLDAKMGNYSPSHCQTVSPKKKGVALDCSLAFSE